MLLGGETPLYSPEDEGSVQLEDEQDWFGTTAD
jgi:hypothetical protein